MELNREHTPPPSHHLLGKQQHCKSVYNLHGGIQQHFNVSTMSRSIDPGHFFQTDASEAKRALKTAKSGNKNGNPIALKSKILNAIQDPFSTSIYIAESAGCVRKVDLEVGMNNISRQGNSHS